MPLALFLMLFVRQFVLLFVARFLPTFNHRTCCASSTFIASTPFGRLVEDLLVDPTSKMAAEEGVLAKQRLFQSVHKLTHLKSPSDKITSVAIPFALVGLGALMMGRGLNHLYTSTGKIEGAA